jgi:hypothetical protein
MLKKIIIWLCVFGILLSITIDIAMFQLTLEQADDISDLKRQNSEVKQQRDKDMEIITLQVSKLKKSCEKSMQGFQKKLGKIETNNERFQTTVNNIIDNNRIRDSNIKVAGKKFNWFGITSGENNDLEEVPKITKLK